MAIRTHIVRSGLKLLWWGYSPRRQSGMGLRPSLYVPLHQVEPGIRCPCSGQPASIEGRHGSGTVASFPSLPVPTIPSGVWSWSAGCKEASQVALRGSFRRVEGQPFKVAGYAAFWSTQPLLRDHSFAGTLRLARNSSTHVEPIRSIRETQGMRWTRETLLRKATMAGLPFHDLPRGSWGPYPPIDRRRRPRLCSPDAAAPLPSPMAI
jgi:hypothetical protein